MDLTFRRVSFGAPRSPPSSSRCVRQGTGWLADRHAGAGAGLTSARSASQRALVAPTAAAAAAAAVSAVSKLAALSG